MKQPESSLRILATVVHCLTELEEKKGIEPTERAAYHLMRDVCTNIALSMQTDSNEAGAPRDETQDLIMNALLGIRAEAA